MADWRELHSQISQIAEKATRLSCGFLRAKNMLSPTERLKIITGLRRKTTELCIELENFEEALNGTVIQDQED